jgi:hypothetical protein
MTDEQCFFKEPVAQHRHEGTVDPLQGVLTNGPLTLPLAAIGADQRVRPSQRANEVPVFILSRKE